MTTDRCQNRQIAERAALCRKASRAFASWAAGYGVIQHTDATQLRAHEMADLLRLRGVCESTVAERWTYRAC